MHLIYFENGNERFCYVVMQNDISECSKFHGLIKKDEYFDWETPYGYGGPLCDVDISKESQLLFLEEIKMYCKEHNIVSQFVRFHPMLNNFGCLNMVLENRYLRDTIYIDTSDKDLIMKNMDSKNRNMVRKAIKNEVTVVQKDITEYDDFVDLYIATMRKNNADEYYIFGNDYFEYLSNMKENACMFYAMYEDKPISGAIMFYNKHSMHYHLSGSDVLYRQFSPSNLMLYEAALWANSRGIKGFHLGGGMNPDDSLFGFKKQFNKNGRLPFYVGRTIFSQEKYDELLAKRKAADDTFDIENSFMIQYRR